jgi:hypothetical protein
MISIRSKACLSHRFKLLDVTVFSIFAQRCRSNFVQNQDADLGYGTPTCDDSLIEILKHLKRAAFVLTSDLRSIRIREIVVWSNE